MAPATQPVGREKEDTFREMKSLVQASISEGLETTASRAEERIPDQTLRAAFGTW